MNNMFCFVNFLTESMQIEKHIKKKDQFDVGFGFLIDIYQWLQSYVQMT